MERSNSRYKGYWYLAIAVLAISLGPVLLAFRASSASYSEKLIYVTLFVPLGLLVILINYMREKTQALTESNSNVQQDLVARLNKKYRKYLLFYIPITIICVSLYAWILLGGKF